MDIVGTVDSAYKTAPGAISDRAGRLSAARAVLETSQRVGKPLSGGSKLKRASAYLPRAGAAGPDSVQERGRCRAMGDERHEAQPRAAARAGGAGR